MVRTGEKNGEHQTHAKLDSKGIPTETTQSLEEALIAAEAILDGPIPDDAGPREAKAFRVWIECASQARDWPDPTIPIPNFHWRATKERVSLLLEILRATPDATVLKRETQARIDDILKCYMTFGILYALNFLEPAGRPIEEREPRYAHSGKEKAGILEAVLNGWTMPGTRNEEAPGILWLLRNDHTFAQRGLSNLKFFFVHIDYYLESMRSGSEARKPVYLQTFLEQAISVEEAWVKFMIRYHRQEVTIRDSILRMMRHSPSTEQTDRRNRKEFWALRNINFAAHRGDVVGIVGRNGSGKTTLLKTLAGILGADRGRVVVRGKVGCLLSFGVGFNSNLSGKENVYLNGSILGLSERDIDERLNRIVEFSELGEFINAPVRTYSAGMRGRLGFSIAIHIDPDILILDEVLSVGDAYFRSKAGSIVDRFQYENKTVVIASHSMDLIRKLCTKAVWIDKGEIRQMGNPTDITKAYVQDCRNLQQAQASTADSEH